MSSPPSTESLLENHAEFEKLVYGFDKAWQSGQAPRLTDFLPQGRWTGGHPAYRKFLEELVKIDLEYRWREGDHASGKARLCLEDYARSLAEFGLVEHLSAELIGEEYRVRQRWGDRPRHAEYVARFPRHGAALLTLLQATDKELAEERATCARAPGPAGGTAAPAGPAAITSHEIIETLRQQQLLGPAHLNELIVADLQGRLPDLAALGKELLERGWLTQHQVEQVLAGRAAELVLGPYVLLERLGEGGAGQVYKARHHRMKRVVALKLIRKELLAEPEVIGRFSREIEVISRLSHPNVVAAYDGGQVGSTQYLVMEYVAGVDLYRLVKQEGPLPVAQALDFIRQAALGLQHIHEHGLVHRDIKPSNLLLDRRQATASTAGGDGRLVRILDLGLARLCRHQALDATDLANEASLATLTPAGAIMMGTPDYLAPEQALDFHQADHRADVYSLGCTLYFLLTGQPPFAGGTLAQKLLKHQQSPPPDVAPLRPDLPPEFPALLQRMLAKRPEDRFQSMAEVVQALAGHPGASALPPPLALPIPHTSAPPSVTALLRRRWPHEGMRKSWRAVALSALLLAGVTGFLIFAWRGTNPGQSPRQDEPYALDLLQAEQIPPEERLAQQPEELVAVLGEQRGRHWGPAFRAVYSPDGQRIASVGSDRALRLWDAATLREHSVVRGLGDFVTGLAYAPDGQTLAVGNPDGALRLVDVKTRHMRTVADPHEGDIACVAFSADGKLVASGGVTDKFVRIYDVRTAGSWGRLRGFTGPVYALAFSPDNRLLAAGSKELGLADLVAVKTTPATVNQHGGPVVSLAIDREGKLLASASTDGTVKLWDLAARQATKRLDHGTIVSAVAFSPDGRTVASATLHRNAVRFWDVSAGKQVGALDGIKGDVSCLNYSPDGQTLLSVSKGEQLRLWDVATGKQRWPRKGHGNGVVSVAFGADGKTLASAGMDGSLIVWDLLDRRERRTIPTGVYWDPGFQFGRMSLSPDGKWVAAGMYTGGPWLPQVWDMATGQNLHIFKGEHGDQIFSVVFSPDGQTLASGSRDGSIKLWNMATGEIRRTLLSHRAGVRFVGLAFSPDGQRLASVDDGLGTVKVWEVSSGAQRLVCAHGREGVVGVAFSPDGKLLASGGGNDKDKIGTVKLWDAGTGAELATLPGHQALVTSVTFSPNSQLVASSSHDGTVRLWNAQSGKLQKTFVLSEGFGCIGDVAFSSDGRHLATANGNGTIYILRLAQY